MQEMTVLSVFWENKSENGEKFFSGKLGVQELIIFDNNKKTEAKHPDKKVYIKTKENEYIELFSLWQRTSKNGNTFFTAPLNYESDMIGFLQTKKKSEKAPDLKLYIKQKQRQYGNNKAEPQQFDDKEEIPF